MASSSSRAKQCAAVVHLFPLEEKVGTKLDGCGKTTLAQYIYNSNKHSFESAYFAEEIGKHFKQTFGLLELQKQLLRDILGGKNKMISSVSEGTNKIKEALHMKKVLVVLDDIDDHDELSALLGTSAFHTQSKIIITTRLLDIHSWFESISWRCYVNKLQLLNNDESLEVFSCHAFGSKRPLESFSDLAVELAQYCEGNPLALKVLGSSLFVSAEDPREISSIIEIWRSRLNSLTSMKGDLDFKIQGLLQKSFDSLPLASYKELFLHIVVFFIGEDEDYVVKILEHDCHAKAGIISLINRCLLTVSSNKKLMMHQLLQDMGRNIICEESKNLARHTRVWCSDEAYRLLTKGDASETIEGLTLDMRKLKKGTKALAIKTSSLAKMHKLKLLQLKYVKLSGQYKNIPDLRWLCWHGCLLKAIPSNLLTSNFLVAIDMTNGNIEKFEPPMVLSSMKILNLTACVKLDSIHKLYRLPNLETLILWQCSNLIHVCKSIESLENLSLLDMASCRKLLKDSLNKRVKALCIGGGMPDRPLFSLPQSLKFLFLDYCNLEYHNDLNVLFSGPLVGVSLEGNLFEFLPSTINLKMLRVLKLTYCINLKSIMCLPSTLEELYTYRCKSLEKITFQSTRFRLRKFGYEGCFKLTEVQGLFKLAAIKELHEAELRHLKWIKAYQDHKVDLVGDEITEGRVWHIQMLYEYGIRSTYLQGIKDDRMSTFEYTSKRQSLSFHVPLHPMKHRIQGLNVSCSYRSSGSKDEGRWPLFTKVSNITKGVTWIYNPMVYCKSRGDEDAMWLSYWPIGNILEADDEIHVLITTGKGMIVSECGASLVYMDGGEVEQEEEWGNNTMKTEEVIGGDLSEFEVSTRVYYLCRRDFFKSETPDLIKKWFGDSISCTTLQGWRKSHESRHLDAPCMMMELAKELNRDTLFKHIWLGYFNSESDIRKIEQVVYRLVGVEYVYYDIEKKTLAVGGGVDSVTVETCVREFEKTVTILHVSYDAKSLLQPCQNQFISDRNCYRLL
ncbi:hypothetical protein QVD17_39730 [Tagetes erecta]|uniref:NB-ARC domain-containing protein n=1 Tax=Tagetes erecta TaxID=13708 RepID=A0AAD8JP25_TARER|nr:hypothetical protein QVD17_39730 [Tagetes erecta]